MKNNLNLVQWSTFVNIISYIYYMNKCTFLLLAIIFLFYNCETTHSSRKLILNDSMHTFQLEYNNYWGTDSIFIFQPGEHIYIINTQKLGNHPDELPYPPCSIGFEDTLNVILNNYTFVGDFKDEYRWEESLGGDRHTVHECRFTIIDNDFQ